MDSSAHRGEALPGAGNGCQARPADVVRTVYELREAAVGYGLALAQADREGSAPARDRLLERQIALEEKTVAAIDECADDAIPGRQR